MTSKGLFQPKAFYDSITEAILSGHLIHTLDFSLFL